MNQDIKLVRVQRFREIDLYPVTCEELSNGRSDEEILEAVIEGGAKIVQLRDKRSTKKKLLQKAKTFRQITAQNNVLLMINDHIDIAMAADADGVHLGQNDFPIQEARKLMPDKIIGASTHNLLEALTAEEEGADYINIGPIFSTQTKEGAHSAIGVDSMRLISSKVALPFTVMGGINLENLGQVLSAGAKRIAVITVITKAEDVCKTVQELRRKIMSAKV